MTNDIDLRLGDCIASMRELPDQSVHTCVTSPPYFGLRDYGHIGQIGLEPTPDAYVAKLVEVFREVKRILRDDGTLWLNLGDSYAGSRIDLKNKDLIGIPWRVAFALQADGCADWKAVQAIGRLRVELIDAYRDAPLPDRVIAALDRLDAEYREAKGSGWYLRQDIIWHKPNPMPESVTDRCTKAHEYIFLLSKSPKYYFDNEAIKEPATESSIARISQPTLATQVGSNRVPGKTNGNMKAVGGVMRNKRSVWTVTTKPFKGAHFATFPHDLIEPCILAGCPEGGTVLDPFGGSGTTAGVAIAHGRKAILCELNPEYAAMVDRRVQSVADKIAVNRDQLVMELTLQGEV